MTPYRNTSKNTSKKVNLSSHQAEDLIRSVGERAMARALASLQQKPEQQELVSEQEPVRLPRGRAWALPK
jgi:hypothetical protein